MHVGLHQLRDNIDVFVSGRSWWFENVDHVDYILVFEELEKLDFTDDTLCINQVFKRLRNFFNSDFRSALMVICRAHHTIGTVADLLDVFVLRGDVESGSYKQLDDEATTYLNTQRKYSPQL